MRIPQIIASVLIFASIPTINYARTLGTCLGTFEIGRSAGASTEAFPSMTGGIRLFNRRSHIFPCMDSARQETHIDEVQGWNPTVHSPLSKQYTGKGVVFGIIETEFDTHHPAFLDSLGHTRFLAVWDETNRTKPSNVRAPYGGYGQIEKGQTLDADSLFATNGFYHGTIVTSFGAGSDRTHPWWGAAPEATIVGVKYGDSVTDVPYGLKWIFHIADSLGMPCVVNMSIGSQVGPHDGTSVTDQVIDSLSKAKAGHIVVGAAGNDGEQKPHVSFLLGAGQAMGAFISSYATNDPALPVNVETYADIWGSANRAFTDTIYVCDTTTMQYQKTTTITPNTGQKTILWPNASTGKNDTLVFQVGSERNAFNSKPHTQLVVFCNNPNLMIGVRIASTLAETVHVWNANKLPFRSLGIQGFYDGDSLYTIDEIGGTAKEIITAGGYNSKVALTTWNGVAYGPGDTSLYHYLSYTSLGPTADGRMKPDLSAPARFVVGAMSRVGKDDNRTVLWPNPPDTLGRYEFTGGTSVASPIVAGIVALMLQADSTLTADNVKLYLQQTATSDAYTSQGGTQRWGAGKVNALEAMKKVPGVSISTVMLAHQSPLQQQKFRIAFGGGNRLVIRGPTGAGQEAVVELFDVSGRRLMAALVKAGGSITLPPGTSAQGCIVARVRWQGGASFERLFSAM
jgi:subtilisin family serine protease